MTGVDGMLTMSDVLDRLAVLPQYLLPKRLLTVLAGKCATSQARWWTRLAIPWFIARYGVNMAEAVRPAAAYASFNDFFTRALRDGARPLAPVDFVSPVDGVVIACGRIEAGQLLQAKGHRYSTRALVGAMPGRPRSLMMASSPPCT